MRPECFRIIPKTPILTIQRNDTQLICNTTQSIQSFNLQLISRRLGVENDQNKFASGKRGKSRQMMKRQKERDEYKTKLERR